MAFLKKRRRNWDILCISLLLYFLPEYFMAKKDEKYVRCVVVVVVLVVVVAEIVEKMVMMTMI